MKKILFIIYFGFSFIFSNEVTWSTTRFEHWWNDNFNSTIFRDPFTFAPYKFKIGSFIYGGDDFWNQYFDEGTSDLNASPFLGDTDLNYNFIDDLKFRKGIDIEIDFLGYNFFHRLQNSIDIITSLSYKFSGPLNKTIATGWPDNNNSSYYYYPITNHYKINSQLSLQITEKLSPYLRLSFGKVEGKIFIDSDDNNILKAKGISESIDLGFHLIRNLKNKSYNLLYGFEIGLDKIIFDQISNSYLNPIKEIKKNNIAIRFSVGIIYGGNKTQGDRAFKHLINSDYVDAIKKFNQFKINNPYHPKVELANEMIAFSNTQIAYDMLYKGMESYRNNDIDSSLVWYNRALEKTNDSTLIYEIESRKYMIANSLFKQLNENNYELSVVEKIDYLNYFEEISEKIIPYTTGPKVELLYENADSYLSKSDYLKTFNTYYEINQQYPNYNYIFKGKLNNLISLLISDINQNINLKQYFKAYDLTKLLNKIYPNINDYIDSNLNILRTELDFENTKKRREIIKEIIDSYKKKFDPIDDNTFIQIGDSYSKSIRLLGEPIELKNRSLNQKSYFMAVYDFKGRRYRLFFENDVLFDILRDK